MHSTPDLDSTISTLRKQLKGCASRVAGHYCFSSQNCGCSSVVEHLLAKEDVASSSLVTRSFFVAASLCEAPRSRVKHTRPASPTGRRLQPASAAKIRLFETPLRE